MFLRQTLGSLALHLLSFRWFLLRLLVLAVLVQFVGGCAAPAPTATPVPPQPTATLAPPTAAPSATPVAAPPTTAPAVPPRAVLSGEVLFGVDPVPGAKVELYPADGKTNSAPAVAFAVADAQGRYAIFNPPAGDWLLIGSFPDGEQDAAGYPPLRLAAGESVGDITVRLERAMTLVEPAAEATVGNTPTLVWKSFSGAKQYKLWIVDTGTTELVFDLVAPAIEGDNTLVAPPLTPGRVYDWIVSAQLSDDIDLATATGRFVVASAGPTPTVAPSAFDGLPPSCMDRSGQFAPYDGRELGGYCFLYPTKFEKGELGPGQPGLLGPALDQSAEPIRATLQVAVTDLPAGTTFAEATEAFLQEQPAGVEIQRTAFNLGSEPAVVLEPVPGRLASRVVLAAHGDKLFALWFWPAPTEAPQAQADVEALYESVTGSFTFLP